MTKTQHVAYEDRPTLKAPPGRPCGYVFCGDVAMHRSDRCERHAHTSPTSPTVKMHPVKLEAFREACK